ncbi:PKD domain containing protein [Candidatus Magnetobacterium bavaricum]|uniref:PKD domain containing protein n=1 Tax=Candidatus Magnetobacterium bavaricum TaxID=29290 RepID=A0A0F3GMB1_9BACT|nr:PKD domain containing protein [Candidatus Magnetobacterium bavaricum]
MKRQMQQSVASVLSVRTLLALMLVAVIGVACLGGAAGNAFAEDYTFVTTWGSVGSGESQFSAAQVAVDATGYVYVVDYMHYRIQKLDSNGNFKAKWGSQGSGDDQFNDPRGIAVDTSGNVYVSDVINNNIQKFDSNGNFKAKWGNQGTGNGQFNWPFVLAVDTSGNVYVTDVYNNRIQKFAPSSPPPPTCTYTLSPTTQNFSANGGTDGVNVTTTAGCKWTATSNNVDWLKVTSGGSGNGNGAVVYTVDANTGGPRTGTITIADKTFTVTQKGQATPTHTLVGSNYRFANVGTTSDSFSMWTKLEYDGQPITNPDDFCHNHNFVIRGTSSDATSKIVAKSTGCIHLIETDAEGKKTDIYRLTFKIEPVTARAAYFKDGVISMCDSNFANCDTRLTDGKDKNIPESFSVYGTTFDIKKHAYRFGNGQWNEGGLPKKDFLEENNFNDIAETIEAYLSKEVRERFWSGVGRIKYLDKCFYISGYS